MTKIVLATSSPYRKELFRVLGIKFDTENSGVNESLASRDSPENLVGTLSQQKAESVAKNKNNHIVIGFDSVGFFDGKILEKPKSRDDAFDRLKDLSGNSYHFYTGIHMINTDTQEVLSEIIKSTVTLRNFSDQEINKYLDEDPSFNTYAHGYDPVGHYSSSFIKNIEGNSHNVFWGFPLAIIVEMLNKIGYKLS